MSLFLLYLNIEMQGELFYI